MTRWRLVYLAEAQQDLVEIATTIAEASGNRAVAQRFAGKIRARCRLLAQLPGSVGTLRPEFGAGLRTTPHGNYLIVLRYRDDRLEIVNVVYAGRDLDRLFEVAPD